MGEIALQRHASEPSSTPLSDGPMEVTPGQMASVHGAPFLAADVGGTHARIALVVATPGSRRPVKMLHYHRYICAEWSSISAMLQNFVTELASTPHAAAAIGIDRCALACAGYVLDDAIVNENLLWPVSIRAIGADLGMRHLRIINDFEAAAYAAQFIDISETRPVIDVAQPAIAGPVLVMGPGTGLGSAVLLPGKPRAQVLPAEAGQVALAPGTEREIEILRVLGRERQYVSYEDALSGPGLVNLYSAVCELSNCRMILRTPAEITAAALTGTDAAALESLTIFCGLLGSYVGDLVMLYRASAVYLAGGILPQIQVFLQASRFAERYFNKGVMRDFLHQVPVRLIEHGQLGVMGAAAWFLDTSPAAGHAEKH